MADYFAVTAAIEFDGLKRTLKKYNADRIFRRGVPATCDRSVQKKERIKEIIESSYLSPKAISATFRDVQLKFDCVAFTNFWSRV